MQASHRQGLPPAQACAHRHLRPRRCGRQLHRRPRLCGCACPSERPPLPAHITRRTAFSAFSPVDIHNPPIYTAALSREQIISTVPLGHPSDFPVHIQPASGYYRPDLHHGWITSKGQEESAAGGFTCRRGRACTELVRQEEAGVVRCAKGPKGMKAAMSAASTSLGRLVAGTPSDRAASFTLMLSRGQPSRLCSL